QHRRRRRLRPDHRAAVVHLAQRIVEVAGPGAASGGAMKLMTPAGRLRLVIVTALLGLLELACRAGWVDPVAVIPPSRMVEGAWQLLASGQYTADILLTLTNVAIACSLA